MNTRVRATRIPLASGVRYWLDETSWVELTDPDPAVERSLQRADGWTTKTRRDRGLRARQASQADEVLRLLLRHGLAVEGAPHSPLAGLAVGLCGSGALARSLANALLRAGVRHLDVLDADGPDPQVWTAGRPMDGAAALVSSLRPRMHVRVRRVPDVASLVQAGIDVVLVAPGALEPDRVLLDDLTSHDLPQLLVGCHQEVGRIGPLVLPGRTPCSRCHDLARTVQDPAWPHVLARLVAMPARPHPTMTAHVASRAVLELGWLARDFSRASQLAGRVEHLDLTSPEVRESAFPLDPNCPCQWER